MTILYSDPTCIACGSLGVIHRVKGWRLPSACVPFIGVRYEDVPTAVLDRYWQWFTGVDRWPGNVHELWAIEDVLTSREPTE